MRSYRYKSAPTSSGYRRKSRFVGLAAAGLGTAMSLTAVTSGASVFAASRLSATTRASATSGCSASAVPLTFWSWVPDIQNSVTLFNKTHPGICVTLQDVGAGSPEFTKLLDAMQAGTGAPDVVQFNYSLTYTYVHNHYLVDLSKYGANSVKKDFPAGSLAGVSYQGGLYAIPQDTGNEAIMYNKVLLAKYGLSVPTTWQQLVADGQKLHSQNPSIYIDDFAPGDAETVLSQMTQAGARPFVLNGTTLQIGFTSPGAKAFATIWDELLSQHLVDTIPDYDTQFYNALNDGQIVFWQPQAWAPGLMTSLMTKTEGDWAIAPLPQFTAGANVGVNGGGSPTAVTAQTKYPQQATDFVIWLNTNLKNLALMEKPPTGLLPEDSVAQHQPSFEDQTLQMTGSQQIYRVFAAAGPDPGFASGYGPFASYAGTATGDQMEKVALGKETVWQMFLALQSQFVSYAKAQGFTVNSPA